MKYKVAKRLQKYRNALESKNLSEDDEVRKMERLVEAEKNDNRKEQARQQGRGLKYGQVIQLRHVMSHSFLRFSNREAATTDVMNMRVELSGDNSKRARCPLLSIHADGLP